MVSGNGQPAGNGQYAGNGQHTGNGQRPAGQPVSGQNRGPLGGRASSGSAAFVPTESVPSEPLTAQERRVADLLRACGLDSEVGDPERGVSEGVGSGGRDLEAEWPVSDAMSEAIFEAFNKDLDERFRLFTAAQLDSTQYETRYLIRGLLAAGQPGGIFGAFKTLKTSVTADLLISLASGTPFLGQFPVAQPGRTLFLSGESGLAALQSIVRRICRARGLSLEAVDNFELSPKLPQFDRAADLRALR